MNVIGALSGFSTNDIEATRKFYGESMGLSFEDTMGGITLKFPGGQTVFIYPKDDHVPATYTVLNIITDSIDDAVDELTKKEITMERYDNLPAQQDEKGILRGLEAGMGPDIAWFKDPGGNIIALLQDS
jgi:predicted enzyme related to lactoylglutathione lyase